MKAVLHVNNAAHQKQHVHWMVEGLGRHGIEAEIAAYDDPRPGDFAVIWGWKQARVIERCRDAGMPVLVMERGHLQDRMQYTSLGWEGLCNRGRYPAPDDGGARWAKHWSGFLKPWRDPAAGEYVLLCGQCDGDASLYGLDFREWAEGLTELLRERGHTVVYRPHPLMVRNGNTWRPRSTEYSTASLDADLAGAKFAVTYNSTVAVEAVLAGVPTVTRDEGSMAWGVTSHSMDEPLWRGDREPWARRLAWCQWNEQEIRSGEAWAAVREVM